MFYAADFDSVIYMIVVPPSVYNHEHALKMSRSVKVKGIVLKSFSRGIIPTANGEYVITSSKFITPIGNDIGEAFLKFYRIRRPFIARMCRTAIVPDH